MTALIVAEAAAILLLGLLVAGLLRSHAEILRKLHDLGVHIDGRSDHSEPDLEFSSHIAQPRQGGPHASDIVGTTATGDAVGISVTAHGATTLLAFLSTGCRTCQDFWEAFSSDEPLRVPDDGRLVIVTKDENEESPSKLAQLAPDAVPVVMSSAAWLDYEVPGSPYFVLVDGRHSTIAGEGSAGSWSQLENLLREAVGDGAHRGAKKWRADADREVAANRELMAAGIHPGHPSLYPEPEATTANPPT